MMERVTAFLVKAGRRSDVVIAVLVLVAVSMMVIPLPTWLVDVLITLNIAFSILILLASLYATSPLQFSALPSAILIATLFRLAITITTTRLILLQADAGEIVTAFGNFVVGGSIAVGLIIFFIITIAQFVVIAKGAERVAEVAARFTLDALPGKQMSIDAELRNGDIDQAQARSMRRTLEQESQFFGAMDGAMKFVKGDVLAGMVFIMVNLIGGFAVGMLQHGMDFAEAGATYSLLSVGDGLVAQIPALLVAVAAGTMVTRVASSEDGGDLGRQITSQLLRDSRSLAMASVIMFVLAIVPGFPTIVFAILGVILGVAAYSTRNNIADERAGGDPIRLQLLDETGDEPLALSSHHVDTADSPLVVDLGTSLANDISPQDFERAQNEARSEVTSDLGINPPPVKRTVNQRLRPRQFRINLDDVPVFDVEIPEGHVLVSEDPVHLELIGIPKADCLPIKGFKRERLIPGRHRAALTQGRFHFVTVEEIPARLLAHVFRKYSEQFVGIQETRSLLHDLERTASDLVAQALETVPIGRLSEILRLLVAEGVTIRNLRVILAAIVEAGNGDAAVISEKVRVALRRQISFRAADRDNIIAAYILDRSAEQDVRGALHLSDSGRVLDLSDASLRSIASQIKQAIAQSSAEVAPVVITAADIRAQVRALLVHYGIDMAVLSYQELAPEFNVQPLGTVTGSKPRESGQGKLTDRSQDVGHS